MNEDKILELLKQLVGDDRGFEWIGKQMGSGIHKSYETTHKAAHAVVGGVSVVARNTHNALHTASDEFSKGWHGYTKDNGPSMNSKDELDRKVDSVLSDYGLNNGEMQFCKARIGIMAEQAKEAMNRESDPQKKEAAGIAAMDKAIKETVEFYGAVKTLSNKGDKGLDNYFRNDVTKKDAFYQKAELSEMYEKLKEAKLSGNPERIKTVDGDIKRKALLLAKGWERTGSEQKEMDKHIKSSLKR